MADEPACAERISGQRMLPPRFDMTDQQDSLANMHP